MATKTNANRWDAGQVRTFAKQILRDAVAWKYLSPKVRRAMVAEEVLSIVAGNFRDVPRDAIIALHNDLLTEVGKRVNLED